MIGKAVIKVPGGKLLKVTLDYDGQTIEKARFTGDFFIHPEDALDRLEERMKKAKMADVRQIVDSGLSDARLYGVDSKSIVKAVREAHGGV